MDKKLNKIIDAVKSVKLSQQEKERVWHNVDAYVLNNHVERTKAFRFRVSMISPYFAHSQRLAVAAFAFLVVIAGGTAAAANSALPNQALYSVKVNVNEQVRSWFAFGAESQAYLATELAQNRLQEAQELAVRGELTPEVKENIQESFKKHSKVVKEKIESIQADKDLKSALAVSTNFEKTLKKEVKSLVKIESEIAHSAQLAVNTVETVAAPETSTMAMKVAVVSENDEPNTQTEPVVENGAEIASKMASGTETEPISQDTAVGGSDPVENVEKAEVTEPTTLVEPDPAAEIPEQPSQITDLVASFENSIDDTLLAKESVEALIPTQADAATQREIAQETRANIAARFARVEEFIATMAVSESDVRVAKTPQQVATEARIARNLELRATRLQTVDSTALPVTTRKVEVKPVVVSNAWEELPALKTMLEVADAKFATDNFAGAYIDFKSISEQLREIEEIVLPAEEVSMGNASTTEIAETKVETDERNSKDGDVAGAAVEKRDDVRLR